jgi:hypothetical protein
MKTTKRIPLMALALFLLVAARGYAQQDVDPTWYDPWGSAPRHLSRFVRNQQNHDPQVSDEQVKAVPQQKARPAKISFRPSKSKETQQPRHTPKSYSARQESASEMGGSIR